MADAGLDILGRQPQTIGRAFSSDSLQIAVAGPDHDFMLVQNVGINYAQNVTRLFDLENSDFQAYVSARPQGQMTMTNIVTNLDNMISFMQMYGDVCQSDTSKNITISIRGRETGGLCRKQGGSVSLSQPALVSTSLAISVADYIVSSNMAFIFASAKSAGTTIGTIN